MARPVFWNEQRKQEAFDKIMARLNGGESLRSILNIADRKRYPANKVFLEWLELNPVFKEQYKAIGKTTTTEVKQHPPVQFCKAHAISGLVSNLLRYAEARATKQGDNAGDQIKTASIGILQPIIEQTPIPEWEEMLNFFNNRTLPSGHIEIGNGEVVTNAKGYADYYSMILSTEKDSPMGLSALNQLKRLKSALDENHKT